MTRKRQASSRAGSVTIGNPAVARRRTPYIEVFKHGGGVSAAGFKYKAAKGFVLSWREEGVGFGQITFVAKKGGLEIETECMGPRFVAEQVAKLLAGAKIVE